MPTQLIFFYFCAWETKFLVWNGLNENSVQANTLQEAVGKEKAAWAEVALDRTFIS